jgi:hypothetical protein
MKKFSTFLEQAKTSLASIQSKRLGLVSDGHGGYHDKDTGEFVAKNVGGRLKFYNQNQVLGSQDPPQVRTQRNQRPVATQSPGFKKEKNVRSHEEVNRNNEKKLRDKYISGEIFKENTLVKSLKNGMVGKIIRRGTNYLICVTENNVMFKPWIRDVVEVTEVPSKDLKKLVKKAVKRIDNNIDGFVDDSDPKTGPYGAFIPSQRNLPKGFKKEEWTNQSGVPADQREVGTDDFRKYAMRMSATKKIINFINKYKAKKNH